MHVMCPATGETGRRAGALSLATPSAALFSKSCPHTRHTGERSASLAPG